MPETVAPLAVRAVLRNSPRPFVTSPPSQGGARGGFSLIGSQLRQHATASFPPPTRTPLAFYTITQSRRPAGAPWVPIPKKLKPQRGLRTQKLSGYYRTFSSGFTQLANLLESADTIKTAIRRLVAAAIPQRNQGQSFRRVSQPRVGRLGDLPWKPFRRGEPNPEGVASRPAGRRRVQRHGGANSASSALPSILSPSCISIARRVLPSRLALNSPAGSARDAPLANVSFT